MLQLIQVSWVDDLGSPEEPGKVLSRDGIQVDISTNRFDAAQSRLADGASDVLFTATLVTDISGNAPYYVLAEIVD
jgi:hypothetical protein